MSLYSSVRAWDAEHISVCIWIQFQVFLIRHQLVCPLQGSQHSWFSLHSHLEFHPQCTEGGSPQILQAHSAWGAASSFPSYVWDHLTGTISFLRRLSFLLSSWWSFLLSFLFAARRTLNLTEILPVGKTVFQSS